MIVENFKNGDAKPVYQRLEERGRLIPKGLVFVSSWVSEDLKTCFQLMKTDDKTLIQEWIKNWEDLVDFEVFPVINSEEVTTKLNYKE